MNLVRLEAEAEIYESNVESGDYKHPYLTYARFVFADDKPNGNNQGIEYEDFPLLVKSAIDMPIKLRFIASTAGGHKGSVPIGHIKEIEEVLESDGTHKLIANAVLYSDEYPEEIKFLKEAYASGNAPGLSWELFYKDEVKKDGISWLKGVIAKAATFVKNPAYGARTALLALASSNDITDDELSRELTALASEISPNNSSKGGSNTMEEKEKQELLAKIAALETQLAEVTGAKAKAETDLLSAQSEVTAKTEVIQQYERSTLISDRTKKVAEAGLSIEKDEAKLKAKQEFWIGLSEDAFTQYLEDLVAASKAAPKSAVASLSRNTPPDLPKLGGSFSDGSVSTNDLKNRLRGLTRSGVGTATE